MTALSNPLIESGYSPLAGQSPKNYKRMLQRNLVLLACGATVFFILLVSMNTLHKTGSSVHGSKMGEGWQLPTISKSITITNVFSRSKLFDQYKLVHEEDLSDEERSQLLADQEVTKLRMKESEKAKMAHKDAVLENLMASQPAIEARQQLPDWDQFWDEEEDQDEESLELDEAEPQLKFLDAVRNCKTLDCLRKAHRIPRRHGQFNFPHALMVGWQKSATTSLFKHLTYHPDVIPPSEKEPEFFTRDCQADPLYGCPLEKQRRYVENTLNLTEYVANAGAAMPFEASTHYGMNGDILASSIYKAMPWVKIVISLREPISRAISMLVHMADVEKHGCLYTSTKRNQQQQQQQQQPDLYKCLITESQLTGHPGEFNFLDSPVGNYSYALRTWLETFPDDQVHLIQYEALIDEYNEEKMLKNFKKFLELDPSLPEGKGLTAHNSRKDRIQPKGWTMKKKQYLDLIERVKPDAIEVAQLAEMYGFGSAQKWLSYWEAVWQDNLSTCDPKGNCKIRPS